MRVGRNLAFEQLSCGHDVHCTLWLMTAFTSPTIRKSEDAEKGACSGLAETSMHRSGSICSFLINASPSFTQTTTRPLSTESVLLGDDKISVIDSRSPSYS